MRDGAPGANAVTDTNAEAPSGRNAGSLVASVMMAATFRFPFCHIGERTSAISPISESASTAFFVGLAIRAPKKTPDRSRAHKASKR